MSVKITKKQFGQLIESLVEQAYNARFASSDPYKKTTKDEEMSRLFAYLKKPNLFFHFSETGKVGINPQATDHPGVRGFYGFKLDRSFFKLKAEADGDWFTSRKKIIVFKLKPGVKILNLKSKTHLDEILIFLQKENGVAEPLKRHQFSKAEQTKLLQSAGYEGIFSKKFMMTDIDNELAIFPPYEEKIDVVEIMDNPFYKSKQNRDFYDPQYDGPADPDPKARIPSKYQDSRYIGNKPEKNKATKVRGKNESDKV